jgi:SAM-dependent methyltransferase
MSANYWDGRYRQEGKIWGSVPSQSAEHACSLFRRYAIRHMLVPGSGYGRHLRFFLRAGYEAEGIELSEEAIRICREDLPEAIVYNGSVLDMPLDLPVYDAIYCYNVLHLFREADRRLFLKQFRQHLQPQGWAYFSVFSDEETSFGQGAEIEPNTFESKPGRPVHYFTAEDLAEHFASFRVQASGLLDDPEDHGTEGPHSHRLRYILVQKTGA